MKSETYLDARWRALQPSLSHSVGLHPEYLVSHSTQATCPLIDASCKAVYPTNDFLLRFLIPWIFKNLRNTQYDIVRITILYYYIHTHREFKSGRNSLKWVYYNIIISSDDSEKKNCQVVKPWRGDSKR